MFFFAGSSAAHCYMAILSIFKKVDMSFTSTLEVVPRAVSRGALFASSRPKEKQIHHKDRHLQAA